MKSDEKPESNPESNNEGTSADSRDADSPDQKPAGFKSSALKVKSGIRAGTHGGGTGSQ